MKQPGLCTLCDKPVFEISLKYPDGHPLERQIRQVGNPLDDAVRATLILTNGNRMDLTFCSDCHATPESLPAIWRKVLRAFQREADDGYRAALEMGPMTTTQREHAQAFMSGMMKTIPIGVLYEAPWKDYGRVG